MMAHDPAGLPSTTTAVYGLEDLLLWPRVKDMPVSMGAEIPEGSKAGNMRKVKSRENQLCCFVSVCTAKAALCVCSLLYCHIT